MLTNGFPAQGLVVAEFAAITMVGGVGYKTCPGERSLGARWSRIWPQCFSYQVLKNDYCSKTGLQLESGLKRSILLAISSVFGPRSF